MCDFDAFDKWIDNYLFQIIDIIFQNVIDFSKDDEFEEWEKRALYKHMITNFAQSITRTPDGRIIFSQSMSSGCFITHLGDTFISAVTSIYKILLI